MQMISNHYSASNRVKSGIHCVALPVMLLFAVAASAWGQTIVKNFAGVNFTNIENFGYTWSPPDTAGAAGPKQFAELVNGAFAVYGKDGALQLMISDSSFWTNAGINPAIVAPEVAVPRIIYDADSGRWFASELSFNPIAGQSQVLVARSDTANPVGTWKAVSFPASSTFADLDTLGVDALGVYIGILVVNSADQMTSVSLFSIPKADLVAATPFTNSMTRFDALNYNSYGYVLQGVCNSSSAPGHGSVIAIDATSFNLLDRTTITNPAAAHATLSTALRISNVDDGSPLPAHQPLPAIARIDALGDEFRAAVQQVGSNIFMANTILHNGRDAVHWLVLNELNNVILGEGVISDTNFDFYQPSIGPNSRGQFLLGFNRSSTNVVDGNISIYGALGSASDGTVTVGAPFLIQAGSVTNFHMYYTSGLPVHWGESSATMVDPTDDDLFWTIQEIPSSGTAWATQISLISIATNRPNLSIKRITGARTAPGVSISWPLSSDPGYVLQSATSLPTGDGSWTSVTNPITVNGSQYVALLPYATTATFFRLQK